MCWDDGQLRAYLDGELDMAERSAVNDHLRVCSSCRTRLGELEADARVAANVLALLTPRLEGATSPAAQALGRLHGQVAQDRPRWLEKLKARWRTMTEQSIARRWRPALATAIALVLVMSLFSFESVRTAAAQFLGIFRVRRFAVISIDPSRIDDLEALGENMEGLLAGQWETIEEPGPSQTVGSVEEASALAGFQARAPSYLPPEVAGRVRIKVEGRGAARMTMDVAQIQVLLDTLDVCNVTLPDVDQVTVEVEIPPAVVMEYGYGASLSLIQIERPTVHLPPGLDLAQLGEAMLQVLGLTPAEARQFSQTIDWANTLVIPIPQNVYSVQEVSVDGGTGLLFRSRGNGGRYPSEPMLLWEKDGVVHGLSGRVSSTDILSTANSLQ